MPHQNRPPMSSRGFLASLRQLAARCKGLGRRSHDRRDLQEELQSHLEMQTEEYVRQGMAPAAARRAARLRLGGADQIREAVQDERGFAWLESLLQDGRYATRLLRRQPGFTAAAVLTLALGIGANTAIFSIVQGLLLQPLPWPDSGRIVSLYRGFAHGGTEDGLDSRAFQFLRDHARSFATVAAADDFGSGMNLSGIEHPEHITVSRATHEFFPLLEAHAELGRLFTAQDDLAGGAHVAIISDALWRDRLGGSADIIGHAIRLDGAAYTVIGVLPGGFRFTVPTDIWLPMDPSSPAVIGLGPNLDVMARLRPDVSLRQARAELALLSSRFLKLHPQSDFESIVVQSYHDSVFGSARPMLLLLAAAVALVLLIACANVANLLLARGSARKKELAMRTALGAGRARLVRQLLTESVLLSLLGGVAGVLLAWLTLPLLLRLAPAGLPFLGQIGLHLPVLLFALLAATLSGLLFGVLPAWQLSRLQVNEELKSDSHATTAGRARHLSGNLLVATEVALAFLLLAGAGALLQTLLKDEHANPGLDAHQVLTVQTSLLKSRQASTAATDRYAQQVLERLRNLPGVASAAAVTGVPLERSLNLPMTVPGRHRNLMHSPAVDWRAVTPGFFQTLRIRLLQGRTFTSDDHAGTAPVAVINHRLAELFWPGQNPIGKQLNMSGALCQVIGVIADVRNHGLGQPPPLETFVPQAQAAGNMNKMATRWFPYAFVVRTSVPALRLAPAAERVLLAVDPDQPGYHVRTLEQVGGASLADDDFIAFLLSLFAGLALVMGMIGIYGVISYRVAQRTREISIRMVMGASAGRILGSVLGQGMRLIAVGMAAGMLAVVALNRLFVAIIEDASPLSAPVLAAVALTLLLVGLAASFFPARRAMQVDPAQALRGEV